MAYGDGGCKGRGSASAHIVAAPNIKINIFILQRGVLGEESECTRAMNYAYVLRQKAAVCFLTSSYRLRFFAKTFLRRFYRPPPALRYGSRSSEHADRLAFRRLNA